MLIDQTLHRHGAEAARGAHNSEVTGSKPVAGIIQFVSFREVDTLSHQQPNQFTGVAQRKRAVKHRLLHLDHLWSDLRMVMAYTPEDVGSKPTTGIIQFVSFREADTLSIQQPNLFTDVAQR